MKDSKEIIQRNIYSGDELNYPSYTENEKRARMVIDELDDSFSENFKQGMYNGILITLNAEDIKKEENKTKFINKMEDQFKGGFFKRLRIGLGYIFNIGYKLKL